MEIGLNRSQLFAPWPCLAQAWRSKSGPVLFKPEPASTAAEVESLEHVDISRGMEQAASLCLAHWWPGNIRKTDKTSMDIQAIFNAEHQVVCEITRDEELRKRERKVLVDPRLNVRKKSGDYNKLAAAIQEAVAAEEKVIAVQESIAVGI